LGALREGPAEWRGIEGLTDLDELVLGALNGVGDDGGIRAIGVSAFEDRGGRRGVGGGVDQLLDRWLSILDTGLALLLDLVRIRVGALLYRDGQATGIVRVNAVLSARLGCPGDTGAEEVHEVVGLLPLFGVGEGGGADVDGRSEEHTSELQSRFDLVCRLLL